MIKKPVGATMYFSLIGEMVGHEKPLWEIKDYIQARIIADEECEKKIQITGRDEGPGWGWIMERIPLSFLTMQAILSWAEEL